MLHSLSLFNPASSAILGTSRAGVNYFGAVKFSGATKGDRMKENERREAGGGGN
jgi:hypothetical protein